MNYDKIEVRKVAPALGAEIFGVDLSRDLDNRTFAEIRQAFRDNRVIFFHDQELSEEEHLAFARRFGRLNVHPFVGAMEGHPEIIEVLKDVDDRRNFGGLWHSDLSFLEAPPLGSILYAKEAPEVGGDTLWANLTLAYETLSPGFRAMLDKLVAVHSAVDVYGPPDVTEEKRREPGSMRMGQEEEARAEVEHPLVRTHPETGLEGLYIAGNYLRRFKGWTEEESQPLLDFLMRHATREEFTCRYRWRAGDVAFWDNRCTLHYALNDYHGARRRMHRVTIDGDRPV